MQVTRFAPSPTGPLHLGHAYSAWFSSRAAQSGRFLLRIEDIDPTRCKQELIQPILDDLEWLGLSWEEPVRKQSEHLYEYNAAANLLLDRELIYPCFCSRADIARTNNKEGPGGPIYPGTCKKLSRAVRKEKIESWEPFCMRLDMSKAIEEVGELTWEDVNAGTQKAKPELFGDIVLVRKDSPTSYHLSVVYDDAEQNISLITRGTDLFEATDVHRVLQELMGLPEPKYLHHPLLNDSDGRRLANKFKSKSLRSYIEEGETRESILEMFADQPDPG